MKGSPILASARTEHRQLLQFLSITFNLEETNYTSQIAEVQNMLTQDIQKISDQLDMLTAAISSLELEQMNQKAEVC